MTRAAGCLLVFALLPLGARADEPEDVPVVGRPPDLPFSGASGNFEVRARAEPKTVEAEKPLTLTLTARATGTVRHAPERIDLRQVPAFARRFYVGDPEGPTRHPAPDTWEFLYTLKPRSPDVTEVPEVPFVFFNPNIRPATKAFQVLYTDPIPIRVTPPGAVAVPLRPPEAALDLATGPGLLAREEPWRPPPWPALAALLLAPPGLCTLWFLAWRRLYPDSARRAHRRRSHAARLALHALAGAERLPPARQAERAARAVAGYLRQRFELPPAEPTPGEVVAHLRRGGLPAALAERAGDFFGACDAARFLPSPHGQGMGPGLARDAAELVLALEDGASPPAHHPARAAVLLAGLAASPTLAPADLARRAGEEFRQGVRLLDDSAKARTHFRAAAEEFEALRRAGANNPLLFRDLGNSYLLAGDLPRAILSYRRGLRLGPDDRALRDALAAARARVAYPEGTALGRPVPEARPPWLPHVGPRPLFAAALALYALGCVGLTRWRMVRRGRPLALGLLCLLGAGLCAAGLVAVLRDERAKADRPLVVLASDGVLLRRGNGLTYPPRYETPLNAGVEATLRFRRGEWLQVELPGGEVGWVPRAAALVDEP